MTHSFTSSFLLKDIHSRIFLSQIMFRFSDNQTEGEVGSVGPNASRLCTMCSFYVPTAVPPSRAHPHLPDSWNGNRHHGRHQKKEAWQQREPTVCIQKPLHTRTTTAPRFRTWGWGNSKRGPLGNPHSSPNGHRVRSGRRRLWLLPRGNVTVERHWIKGTSGLALSRNFLLSVSLRV